jgi:hypothetical protein
MNRRYCRTVRFGWLSANWRFSAKFAAAQSRHVAFDPIAGVEVAVALGVGRRDASSR